ncbi:hypothetical protein Golax_002386 [Gossypium laxum]|uniref:Uncharacterized protein n=1 Tax=Gossypium laxum TaxID=34288 RepID=A0A7J9AT24_9ROSI|nr:hypothetical protein [Gossypium laxum]
MGSAVIPGKEDLCTTFLGKVSNEFDGHSNALYILKFGTHKVATTPSRLQKKRMNEFGISHVGLIGEPWPELHKTTLAARRYSAIFEWMSYVEPDIIECVPSEFLAKSEYVERKGIADSVCDGGNAQIGSSDVVVQVEAINSATTIRHESTAQARLAKEEQ